MRYLTIILALLVPQLSYARIGETVEQCDKRYGELIETSIDNSSRTYLKKGIKVECFFEAMPEGKCVHIKYSPIKSQKLAKTIWESNHPKWQPITAGSINGVLRAESIPTSGYHDVLLWYVDGDSLRIDTREYSASHPNLDDFDARKKIIAQAIDDEDSERAGEEGEELLYALKSLTPYTGWVKVENFAEYSLGLRQYKDGRLNGQLAFWHKNGKKACEATYKDGMEHGLYTTWFQNGKKNWETNYRDGEKQGLETEWYESGVKRSTANYRDGEMHGLVTEWDENGRVIYESIYKDGEPVE